MLTLSIETNSALTLFTAMAFCRVPNDCSTGLSQYKCQAHTSQSVTHMFNFVDAIR
jgi:hypothetical protein